MSEWQIIESDKFPDGSQEAGGHRKTPGRRARRWLRLAGGLLLLLLVVGLVSLRERRLRNQAALHEDLAAAIFEEETLRRLGRVNDALTVASASEAWQTAYRRTFGPDYALFTDSVLFTDSALSIDNGPSHTLYLVEVKTFDGACATVTVSSRTDWRPFDPLRAYCLTGAGWRRAPLPRSDWGEAQIPYAFSNGAMLRFWEQDQQFAESLAGDLVGFFREASHLPTWGAVSPQLITTFKGLEIIIEPHDLQGPLILVEPDRIVINSPKLVSFPPEALTAGPDAESAFAAAPASERSEPDAVFSVANLSLSTAIVSDEIRSDEKILAEAAVRLALASTLLRRANLVQPEAMELPGADRLASAIQTIIAMRLLLPPATIDQLLADWRHQLDGQWVSPFYAGLLPAPAEPLPQSQAAALLLADYIYLNFGPDVLARILQQLSSATAWDRLLQTQLGQATMMVELETARYAGSNQASLATLARRQASPALDLPLMVKLQQVSAEIQPLRLYGQLSGRIDPVLVEAPPGTIFETLGGLPLPVNCLKTGAILNVAGAWLEGAQRLQATRITLYNLPMLEIDPAPTDTIAFLMTTDLTMRSDGRGTSGQTSDSSFGQNSPSTRPPDTFAALRVSGSLQSLVRFENGMQIFSLPVSAGQSVHFLVQRELSDCERNWFTHYEPKLGLTGQWLGPSTTQWVWRLDRQEPLFFEADRTRQGYHIYEGDKTHTFERIDQSDRPFSLVGWHVSTRQPVAAITRFGGPFLGLLDIQTGQISNLILPDLRALEVLRLSPDGNWLVYPANPEHVYGPSNRADLLNLSDGKAITLVELMIDQRLSRPVWSPYLADPRLAFLAGPVAEPLERNNDSFRPVQLLVAQPDQPGDYTLVAEAESGARLGQPHFCSDGSILYRVTLADQYQLRRQRPGAPAETLLTLDQPFRLLACP